MLKHLAIKNYALIEELEVDFSSGFNIVTGETGAGKSILLGGLSLVLGKRADLGQIKDPSNKCIVEAVLDLSGYNLEQTFKALDLDYDHEMIIRRELLASGKSRAFVNDTPVTLDTLAALSGKIIDIHSQNQTSLLTDKAFMFSVIDGIAKNQNLLAGYSEAFKQYQKTLREIESLRAKQLESNKILDYNKFLLQELNELTLSSNEFSELEEQQLQLENAEIINQRLQLSSQILGDESLGVIERLKEVKKSLDDISNYSVAYSGIKERVLSTVIELEDIFRDLQSEEESLVSDPQSLFEVNEVIQKVNQLLLKHQVQSFEQLEEIRAQLQDDVDKSGNLDERIAANEKEKQRLEVSLNDFSKKISVFRAKSIPGLVKRLESILGNLGMPNARFDFTLYPLDNFSSNGKDGLDLRFKANKGTDFKKIKTAASGGELSRIMLAIKAILAEHEKLPTLIFDEIDTGVSGEIAELMAKIMKQMSAHFQVISITHLPQVAAKGESHYKVFKVDEGSKTLTQIKHLNEHDRVQEIAQMLGGSEKSESAIAHAKQLLN